MCDTLCNLTTPQLTLTMSQCPCCFMVCPSDNSLACHIRKCPRRIRLSACPHVKKQVLHCSKTQSTPVQVVIDQQRVVATFRNDMHTASTSNGCSTLADLLHIRVWSFEARCTAAPTTNFDAGGCSPDNTADNASDYHTESFSDSNYQSHNGSLQIVDDDEMEKLLSNDKNSHTCLQQILQALYPSQQEPCASSNCEKDTMGFIPASSPKHVPLSVEERAQLDLLRILGKAGVSPQIQDIIIDWA